MEWSYLGALLISVSGLAFIDWRYKVAFWYDHTRTIKVLLISMAVFIIWDLLGIGLGIFFHGGSAYTLPLRIVPEFPLEELFFLLLLCYVTLLIYLAGVRLWSRT